MSLPLVTQTTWKSHAESSAYFEAVVRRVDAALAGESADRAALYGELGPLIEHELADRVGSGRVGSGH